MPGYQTELENFSSLVENKDIEPLDTADMLASNLKNGLGSPYSVSAESPDQSPSQRPVVPEGRSTEELLGGLYDTLDSAIEAFETVDQTTQEGEKTAEMVTELIHKLQSCIQYIGGPVEPFNPLDHVSGLLIPDLAKNAEKVAQNTQQFYKRGLVKAQVGKQDGTRINVVFSGRINDITYSAVGTIDSVEWDGNEAIDYVYTKEGGKMSVKRLSGGRWADISDMYDIRWELMEQPTEDFEEEGDEDISDDISVKNKDVWQEQEELSQNNGKEHSFNVEALGKPEQKKTDHYEETINSERSAEK